MSTPLITNRLPAPGSVAGVKDSMRFSVRSPASQILSDQIQCYYGSGPVHYEGQVLPEERTDHSFILQTYGGTVEDKLAVRTLGPEDELVLIKNRTPLPQIQEAVYFFGGLESPANPDAPLMVEATLKLVESEITFNANYYSGVAFGVMAGAKGVSVKFYSQGGVRRIEVQSAGRAITTPPSSAYRADFEWNNVWVTYKLLWHPIQNKVKLYISSGAGDTPDILLIDGLVSAFADLPLEEQRPSVPWTFFGHTESYSMSTSRWKFVALYNLTDSVIHDGIVTGKYVGFLETDEVVYYDSSVPPDKAGRPWNPLPASFGTIGGQVYREGTQIVLERNEPSNSHGYYRKEPKVTGRSVLDFTASGEVFSQGAGVQTTGMEFYIDDGTRCARVAFLQDEGGTQYIGLLLDDSMPQSLLSYIAFIQAFIVTTRYRIVLDPVYGVQLFRLVDTEVGTQVQLILGTGYGSLPLSSMPGPGFGFLHNANSGAASARLRISRVRYSTDIQGLNTSDIKPSLPSGWVKDGNGTITPGDDYATLTDADETAAGEVELRRDYVSGLEPSNGIALEFQVQIASYSAQSVESPVRVLTGFRAAIIDDSYQTALLFADAGPPNGKIVFLQTQADPFYNLELIRSGDKSVVGTYVAVDWMLLNLYRLEKTIRGKLRLYINNDDNPVLSFDQRTFPYADSPGGIPRLVIGHFGGEMKTESHLAYVFLSVSKGYDVCLYPDLKEAEVLERFNHSVNHIVEVASA